MWLVWSCVALAHETADTWQGRGSYPEVAVEIVISKRETEILPPVEP